MIQPIWLEEWPDVLQVKRHQEADPRLRRGDEKEAQHPGAEKALAEEREVEHRIFRPELDGDEQRERGDRGRERQEKNRMGPSQMRQAGEGVDERAVGEQNEKRPRDVDRGCRRFAFLHDLPREIGAVKADRQMM
jgi:hypothetical protein